MIREDKSNTSTMELVFPDQTIAVPYATLAGVITDYSDPALADAVRDYIYSQIDTRLRRNRLPQDDSARDVDPATEGYFWEGDYIVSRPYIVTVAWDGERFQYGFRLPR